MTKSSADIWTPLELSPESATAYTAAVAGANCKVSFTELFSLEDWALEMIPHPTVGLLLIYPVGTNCSPVRPDGTGNLVHQDREFGKNELIEGSADSAAKEVWFMKQEARNACGTVAFMHLLMNLKNTHSKAFPDENTMLANLYEETKSLSPEERGKQVEKKAEEVHESTAVQVAATAVPPSDAEVDDHYVAFVVVDGHLYELDGRKTGPVHHGACSENQFLKAAAGVVEKNFIRDNKDGRFALVAASVTE